MRSRATVPARICLAGEDLDWMAGTTLLTAVDLTLQVVATPFVVPELRIRSGWPIHEEAVLELGSDTWETGGALDHVAAATRRFQSEFKLRHGVQLDVSTEFPSSAGLSSSAAVILGTLLALSILNEVKIPIESLVQMAYETEHDMLDTGCGPMDFEVCARGGIQIVDTHQQPASTQRLNPPPFVLVILDTEQSRATGAVIAHKRLRFATKEPGIMRYQERASSYVTAMIETLESASPNLNYFGDLITKAHRTMREDLGVSTSRIERACDIALGAGALGVKITGTGLGGCVFALAPTEDDGKRLSEIAQEVGFPSYIARPTSAGASGVLLR